MSERAIGVFSAGNAFRTAASPPCAGAGACLADRKLGNYPVGMLREDLSRNFGFLLTDVARLMRTSTTGA